jgi:hypothetical protein
MWSVTYVTNTSDPESHYFDVDALNKILKGLLGKRTNAEAT